MVELEEVNKMLQCSDSSKSTLLIVDEFGRGTSTHDGMALAGALLKNLQSNFTLAVFSTHFKNLAADNFIIGSRNFMNFHCEDERIRFLYKLERGVCPSSFAHHAARFSGINECILTDASSISKETVSKDISEESFILSSRLEYLSSLIPVRSQN